MKIADLFDSIKGKIFKKNDICQNIEQTFKEFNTYIIPVVAEQDAVFGKQEPKSKVGQRFQTSLQNALGIRNATIFKLLHINAINACTVTSELEKMVNKEFTEITTDATLTFSRSHLLQLVSGMDFYSRYIQKLITYILINENELIDAADTVKNNLATAEINYVEHNWTQFLALARIFAKKPTDVINMLNKVPEVIINSDNADAATAVNDMSKIDPLRLGMVPSLWNPFFAIGMYVANRQVKKYEETRAQHEQNLLRIKKLKRDQENNPSPEIANRIEYLTDHTNKLAADLARMEKEYA